MNALNRSLHLAKRPMQKTRLTMTDPAAQEVFVAGSFNNWNPTSTPLTDIGHGRWVADVLLPPGRYEYQFVVDGRWMHARAAHELVENPSGDINSVIEVPRFPYHLDPPLRHRELIHPRWRWHYATLLKTRRRLLNDRAEQLREVCQPAEWQARNMAESATAESEHELASAELNAEQNALYEINNALQRILTGTYGICELTNKSIPAARLRAVPWTRYTKEAEENLEATAAKAQFINPKS